MNRPFNALADDEKKILQREVKRLAAALRTRIACGKSAPRAGNSIRSQRSARTSNTTACPWKSSTATDPQAEDRGDLRHQHLHAVLLRADVEFSVRAAGNRSARHMLSRSLTTLNPFRRTSTVRTRTRRLLPFYCVCPAGITHRPRLVAQRFQQRISGYAQWSDHPHRRWGRAQQLQ